MHPDVIPVVEESAVNRARFAAICRSLSSDELVSPIPDTHWRVKDYIAHLATIDTWVNAWFTKWANGEEYDFREPDGTPINIDAWNEERIVQRKEAPLEDLLAEAAENRIALERTMTRFEQPVLERPFTFGRSKITFLRYLQLLVAHDPAHTADMLKGLPDRQEEASLVDWLTLYKVGPVAEAARAARASAAT